MTVARSDMTATLINDNSILIVGGCLGPQSYDPEGGYFYCASGTAKTELFTPESPTKATVTVLDDAPRVRQRHTAEYVDGKVWLFGGRDDNDEIVKEIDYFDVSTMTWGTVVTPWDDATSDLASFVLSDKRYVHIAGGYDQNYTATDSLALFDTTSMIFTAEKTEMDIERGDATAVVVDNEAYMFAGFTHTDFCNPLENVEKYSPQDNSWTPLPKLDEGRGDKGVTVVNYGGYEYVAIFGGEIQKHESCGRRRDVPPPFYTVSVVSKSIEFYSPLDNKWHKVQEEMPRALFRFPVVSVNLKGEDHSTVFAFGGQGPLTATAPFQHETTSKVISVSLTDRINSAAIPGLSVISTTFALLLCLVLGQ